MKISDKTKSLLLQQGIQNLLYELSSDTTSDTTSDTQFVIQYLHHLLELIEIEV